MMRNFEGGGALIEQWLKNKDTVLFLGVWERINNPDFNSLEFEGIRNLLPKLNHVIAERTFGLSFTPKLPGGCANAGGDILGNAVD